MDRSTMETALPLPQKTFYVQIARKKTNYFTYALDDTTVKSLRKEAAMVFKVKPENLQLVYDDKCLEDSLTLAQVRSGQENSLLVERLFIGAQIRKEDNEFEDLDISIIPEFVEPS